MKRLALSLALSFAAIVTVAGVFAAGFSGLRGPDESQAASLTNTTIPISIASFVQCANKGLGEVVLAGGALHVVSTSTIDAQGNLHASVVFNPQGVNGTGTLTGSKYQGAGVTRSEVNYSAGVAYNTFTNNFLLIGQGAGNNLVVHTNGYVTVFPNGNVFVNMVKGFVSCS